MIDSDPSKTPGANLQMESFNHERKRSFLKVGFYLSVIAIVIGVALHVAEYAMEATPAGFLPKNAKMGMLEKGGMVLIVCGLVVAAGTMFSLYDVASLKSKPRPVVFTTAYFDLLQSAHWTRTHTQMCAVLTLAITIDLMKPATIGFIMPGLLKEYGLSKPDGSVLPTVAITGTVIGSILWGFMADRIGRRYSILLSTILFIATSICGAMPSFPTNVFMCWLMGVSVGGLIPVAVSLLSEVVPPRVRSTALITILSIGSAFGYLAASGMSYLLQTWFAWRTLWFVGIPTGLLMLPLCNQIPESFRFLIVSNRLDEACVSMKKYFNIDSTQESIKEFYEETELLISSNSVTSDIELRSGADRYNLEESPVGPDEQRSFPESNEAWWKNITVLASLCMVALAWGICNFGFVTYVPTMLVSVGKLNIQDVNQYIFWSSASSCAFVPLYVYTYGFVSSRYSVVGFALWELIGFLVFAGMYQTILTSPKAFCIWYTFLLGAHNAILAMVTVYSAECFSTKFRGRGTGFVAASTKIAGVFAPFSIASILTNGSPWQLSVCVGIPMFVGAILFAVFARETSSFEPDAIIFSPIAPFKETSTREQQPPSNEEF